MDLTGAPWWPLSLGDLVATGVFSFWDPRYSGSLMGLAFWRCHSGALGLHSLGLANASWIASLFGAHLAVFCRLLCSKPLGASWELASSDEVKSH